MTGPALARPAPRGRSGQTMFIVGGTVHLPTSGVIGGRVVGVGRFRLGPDGPPYRIGRDPTAELVVSGYPEVSTCAAEITWCDGGDLLLRVHNTNGGRLYRAGRPEQIVQPVHARAAPAAHVLVHRTVLELAVDGEGRLPAFVQLDLVDPDEAGNGDDRRHAGDTRLVTQVVESVVSALDADDLVLFTTIVCDVIAPVGLARPVPPSTADCVQILRRCRPDWFESRRTTAYGANNLVGHLNTLCRRIGEIETRCGVPWERSLEHTARKYAASNHSVTVALAEWMELTGLVARLGDTYYADAVAMATVKEEIADSRADKKARDGSSAARRRHHGRSVGIT